MADTKNKEIAESLMAKSYLTVSDLQKSEIWEQLLPFSLGISMHPRQLLYHYTNNMVHIPVCDCGVELSWNLDKQKYRTFCSKKCTATFSIELRKRHNLEKHGVVWHSQLPEWRKKVMETSTERFGFTHYSKTAIFSDLMKQLHASKRKPKIEKQPKITTLEPKRIVTACDRKLFEYFTVKGIAVQLKNRTIIKPKEIDIYFPDAALGIEINGGYWHSEQFQPNPNAQLDKVSMAHGAGVELWHFWDWEITDKWDIIISKIEHRLGLSRKLYARQLSVKEVPKQETKIFLESNHIQGACPSKVNLGLYVNDNLVMIATFGSSRFSNKYNWELLRMAGCKYTTVVGGAAKLIAYFKKMYMQLNETLVSYCQRRFSRGNVYNQIGFELQHTTDPGFQYVKSGLPAGSRNQWQKHMMPEKLPVFDPALSGNQNMINNGYYRAWDCGQFVFVLSK
ncbi:Restriction_endonuclease_like domain containing protein [uncultured Caudovirales phage]|uniref:Restriction_endonuclease_like domain containing protein n=1 Tax=uncultured Caudovirales phage TaxID=2100421 RepID=A0A6J5LAL1_9CAUD|nr:Restriction_endonuclease_like domain containing protein [uncultured Caudovirales phage]